MILCLQVNLFTQLTLFGNVSIKYSLLNILGSNIKRKLLKCTDIPTVNVLKSTIPLPSHKIRRSPKKKKENFQNNINIIFSLNKSCEISTSIEEPNEVIFFLNANKNKKNLYLRILFELNFSFYYQSVM